MSEHPDPMIGWILAELSKAPNEGISINKLFNLLDDSFFHTGDAKIATWKILTTRADVAFVDEAKSQLKLLSLTDVLGAGQGDVRIRLVQHDGHEFNPAMQPATLLPSIESDSQVTLTGKSQALEKGLSDATYQQGDTSSSSKPPPKRRGGPPRAKKPVLSQEQHLAANTPTISTRGTARRQSQATVPPTKTEAIATEAESIAVDPALEDGKHSTPAQEREKSLHSTAVISTAVSPTDAPAPLIPTQPLSISQGILNGTTNKTAQGISPDESVAATPLPSSSRPQSPRPLNRANSPNVPLLESTPQPSCPDGPAESSVADVLPEATFVSQADIDWEDGKDGVYVKPPGVKVKKAPGLKKKKKPSTLVVFRSSKLKDPERLVNGKDTWRERILPVVAQARVALDDDAVGEALIPKLNKKRKAAESESTPNQKESKKHKGGVDDDPLIPKLNKKRKEAPNQKETKKHKGDVGNDPLIPKLDKKRKAAESESTPNQKETKRHKGDVDDDLSLAQAWGEAYPDDDYNSDHSNISILEAKVSVAPGNATDWASSWTREGAEEAKSKARHSSFDHAHRASSFTPSDSRTPWGTPTPELEYMAMSPEITSNSFPLESENGVVSALPQSARQPSQDAHALMSNSYGGSEDPSNVYNRDKTFTPSKKQPLGYTELSPSPARAYRSIYAPLESDSQSRQLSVSMPQASEVHAPGDTQSQLYPSASFGTRHSPTHNPSQSSKTRSPYSVPPLNAARDVENSFVRGEHRDTLPDRMNGASSSSLGHLVSVSEASSVQAEERGNENRDTSQPTGLPAHVMDATPAQRLIDQDDYSSPTADSVGFMDKSLSGKGLPTPRASTRGRGHSRGRAKSTRGAGRGGGARGGARRGTRGGAQVMGQGLADHTVPALATEKAQAQALPQASALPANSISVANSPAPELQETDKATRELDTLRTAALSGPYSALPEKSFSELAPANCVGEDVPALNFGPAAPPPSATLETEREIREGSVGNGTESLQNHTPGPGSEVGPESDFNVLGPQQMTPSQPSNTLPSRIIKSRVRAPSAPQSTPQPSTSRVKISSEERLRARIAKAEVVPAPEGAARFSCLYKDIVGNMILSSDQSVLEFFALNQHPPEMAMVSMKVSKIIGNPIMSVKGSFPMELHVKSSNDENKKRGYRFTYAASESGSAAAQSMRTKIVTAMIASEFNAGEFATVAEAQAAKVRPYQCELCADRFKNPNGLEYHITKAQSKCNPNWNQDAGTGRRPNKRKQPSGAKTTSGNGTTQTPRKKGKATAASEKIPPELDYHPGSSTSEEEPVLIPRSARKVTVERVIHSDGGPEAPARVPKQSVNDNEADAEVDSDDSIYDWARKNSTTGYETATTRRSASKDFSGALRPPSLARKSKTSRVLDEEKDADAEGGNDVSWAETPETIASKAPEAPKTAKIYKALHREAEAADQIVRNFAHRIRDGEEEIFGVAITPNPQLTTAKDIATSMTCNELSSQWYEEVVVNLVEKNQGMFPAERSVWFASVAIWLKQDPLATALPESKLCAKAIDELVESKKISRVEFEFKDRKRKSRTISRGILTTTGLDMKTERGNLVKELVRESHPESYVPSRLAPPPSVLEKLQAVAARLLPSLAVVAEVQEVEGEERGASPVPNFSDDSDEDAFVADAKAIEAESSDSDSDKDLDDNDDHPVSALAGVNSSKKRKRTSSGRGGGGGKRERKAGHNAKISEGVRRRFDAIRAGGENPYPWNFKTKKDRMRTEDQQTRREEKRLRDLELAETQRSCWDQAPGFRPNPETGAWDQSTKSTRAYYGKRPQLPEPITFIQAPDGAWSVRPFGHGVKPIYSRPARRAEGNPGLQSYLDRIENGHRPVIHPPVSNRVNLPAVPSRRLLEAVQSGKPIDEATGLPVVSRYASKRKRSSAIALDDENEPAPKKRRGASVHFAIVDDTDEDVYGAKISRLTGKPTRQYSRNFPKQVFASNIIESQISGELAWILPTRKSARKPKFSEVDILNFYEPKKLTGAASRNPGLDTLPAVYGLKAPNAEEPYNLSPDYDNIVFIPSSPIDEHQDPGLKSWTVSRLDMYHPPDYCFRWDDATAFTVENLPYSNMKDDDWIGHVNQEDVDLESDLKAERVEKPKPKRQRKNTEVEKKVRNQKYSYVRQHTAIPQDFLDLFDDPASAGKFFGVEIGVPSELTLKRSRNLASNVMLPETETRFAVACMVIRILAGGLDLQIDWILVGQLFPDYSLNFLKKLWNGIFQRKKPAILKLEDDFRHKFLAAYQANEIQHMDYEHLADYAWSDLVDWTIANTNSSLSNKTIMLPPTREELAEEFELRESKEEGCFWRDNYFAPTTATYKRVMASASVPHSIAFQPRKSRKVEEIDHFVVARSWVRVAAITPNADWSREVAKAKLSSFSKSLLGEVLDGLTAQKIVKKRAANKAKNGRIYEIHDTWSGSLRRHVKEETFIQAITFKRWMDTQFRSGMQSIKADYFANEGTVMCITSLQAHGRIRFHGTNIPMQKFGLGDGGYETKKIPKERLRFNIDIYPTDDYIFDDTNPVLSNLMFRDPPRGGEDGEIPIWYGLTGKPIWGVWYRLLAAIGQVVALRSGTAVQALKESFKNTLEDWEWTLLMHWGSEIGLFRGLGQDLGANEGWTVGEWWWAVVGGGFVDIRADGGGGV